MLAIVTKTVDAHRLKKMRELLTFEKLATFRRMNGFDRDVDREDDRRSLPPTPQEFSTSLRYELQKLKDAISMPRQKVSNLINEIEEGGMDPERVELESSSAGTGIETPGQQCPPNEGAWDQGRTTAAGFLTAGVGSNQGENIFSPTTESVDTRAGNKSTRTTADITFLQQGHKPRSKENKQLDLGGKGEKVPPWNASVTLLFFWGELGGSLLVLRVFCLCSFCALCVLCFLNYCSFQVITSQRAEIHEGRHGSSR